MTYASELLLLALTFVITILHSARETGDQPAVSPLFHGFWFALYAVFSAAAVVYTKSWWVLAAAGLIRGVAYNPVLNYLRREPFFYVNGESTNGSEFDKVLQRIGIFYPILWCIAVVLLVLVQFKL